MKEAFYEIDVSNDIIEIVISKEKELLRFSSFGIIGDTHVIYFLVKLKIFVNYKINSVYSKDINFGVQEI